MTEDQQTIADSFCPLCGSDDIEKAIILKQDGELTEECRCNYCESKFEYSYTPSAIKIVKDNLAVVQMKGNMNLLMDELWSRANQTTYQQEKFLYHHLVGCLQNTTAEVLNTLYEKTLTNS